MKKKIIIILGVMGLLGIIATKTSTGISFNDLGSSVINETLSYEEFNSKITKIQKEHYALYEKLMSLRKNKGKDIVFEDFMKDFSEKATAISEEKMVLEKTIQNYMKPLVKVQKEVQNGQHRLDTLSKKSIRLQENINNLEDKIYRLNLNKLIYENQNTSPTAKKKQLENVQKNIRETKEKQVELKKEKNQTENESKKIHKELVPLWAEEKKYKAQKNLYDKDLKESKRILTDISWTIYALENYKGGQDQHGGCEKYARYSSLIPTLNKSLMEKVNSFNKEKLAALMVTTATEAQITEAKSIYSELLIILPEFENYLSDFMKQQKTLVDKNYSIGFDTVPHYCVYWTKDWIDTYTGHVADNTNVNLVYKTRDHKKNILDPFIAWISKK